MKKTIIYIITIILSLFIGGLTSYFIFAKPSSTLKKLPKPEITEGLRGEEFGIDKNINETTIDEYLNRSDSVYRGMRMLKDPGNYAAIGGDSYLSGFIAGFEVIPYPFLTNVSNIPEEVGETYSGPTLFTETPEGNFVANYEESLSILEAIFPKDKNIFLMCGGGGYANMTKKMLISLGWDENKIYNVGSFWSYQGQNRVDVKYNIDGIDYYNFSIVPYYNIDFSMLHEVK